MRTIKSADREIRAFFCYNMYAVPKERQTVGHSGRQFPLQLFQALALRLGATAIEEEEGRDADGGIDPEAAAAAEGCIHGREEECERAAAHPEGKGADGHGDATHTIGEDFRQQRPGDGAEGHGIAGNGCHDKGYHQHTRLPGVVAGAQGKVDDAQSARAQKHERAPPPLLYGVEGNEREEHIGYARDDDIDEHAIDIVARADEDFLCIVEDDVSAAPLLEDGDEDAKEKQTPSPTLPLYGEGEPSGWLPPHRGGGARKGGEGLCSQEDGTFGNEETHQQKQGSREGLGPEHPAPAPLQVPVHADRVAGVAGQQHIDDLCGQDAQHDGHLVQADHAPANVRRANLRNVHGGQRAGHADADATDEARYIKQGEVVEQACGNGTDREHHRRCHQQWFAPVAVGCCSGHHGTHKTAHQGGGHGYALHEGAVVDAEKEFIEWFGSADDNPVVTEEQSAHGRDGADEEQIGFRLMVHWSKIDNWFSMCKGMDLRIRDYEPFIGKKMYNLIFCQSRLGFRPIPRWAI